MKETAEACDCRKDCSFMHKSSLTVLSTLWYETGREQSKESLVCKFIFITGLCGSFLLGGN